MDIKISFRASEAPSWANCPSRANYLYLNPPTGPARSSSPVGLAVGNAVHNIVTGHEYEEPSSVAFDGNTRTEREMSRQIAALGNYAKSRMQGLGLEMLKKEFRMTRTVAVSNVELDIEGTIDLLCRDADGKIVILDLKTGAGQPRGAWLQLAIYAWLYGATQDMPADKCAILWCPRLKSEKKVEVDYWEKPADLLAKEAERVVRQRAQHAITTPAANPMSLSCSNCPNRECEVRL